MKCHGCFKNFKDNIFLTCSSVNCGKIFCPLCINPVNLSVDKKKWKCPDCCATQRKGGDNSSTPIRSIDDNVTKRKKTDINMDTNTNSDVKELTAEVRLLTQEIHSLKKQLEDTTMSLTHCQMKLEELGSSIAANDVRIKNLEKREENILLLESKITEIKQECNAQAQYNLRNELELVGIPEREHENLHHIVLLAMRKVGVEIDDSDIDWTARVGPRIISAMSAERSTKFPRPVVVRLLRRSKRDQILKASKSRRNITSSDIDIPGAPQKIFYNERLTRENRMLFRATRAKSKEHGYTYCWCTHGTIYVKQHEGKPAVPVRSNDDLTRIFKASAPIGN